MGGYACIKCWDYNCNCTEEELKKFKEDTEKRLRENPPIPFEKSLSIPIVEFGDIVIKNEKQYMVMKVISGVPYIQECTDNPTEDYETKILEEPYQKMELNRNKMEEETKQELTFGQKAVGLTFNPSGDDAVAQVKQKFAEIIDIMNDFRSVEAANMSSEHKRLASIAITEAQTAQMWAVKALTWRD